MSFLSLSKTKARIAKWIVLVPSWRSQAQEMDVQRRMGVSKSHQTLCLHFCIMPKTTEIMVSRLLDSLEEGLAETKSYELLTSCSPNRPAKMTAAPWKGLRMCRRLSIWRTLSSLSRTINILSLSCRRSVSVKSLMLPRVSITP